MRESDTIQYRLAVTPDDFARCHQLAEATIRNYVDNTYDTPTIMAFRDEKLLGFIATADLKKTEAVVCGHSAVSLELNPTARMIVLGRLMEHYDQFMRNAGIKWYHIIADTYRADFTRMIRRAFGIEPYHIDAKTTWFKRELH